MRPGEPEQARLREDAGNRPGKAQEPWAAHRGDACGLGPGCPFGAHRVLWGADFSPRSNHAADHQASCPRNASHPFLQPHHGLRPPQGSKRWRKTGKPTKIFQIRQICGADKSRAGWDEVSVAPQWGGPVKSGLRPQKNASSPTLSGVHCLSYPPKEPTLEGPQ